ncbi:transposase [Piscirickettsia salmonis]|uniref:transposase n=1 Tax=Piscirickettsia salmonis TaxID=1238 RepID=UPI0032B756DC
MATKSYLPSYSPDLNPIERKWAEAKAIRRKYRCSIEDLFLEHLHYVNALRHMKCNTQ